MENVRDFVELVAEMRQAQINYFHRREYSELMKSKKLEKCVDKAIVDFRRALYSSKVEQLKIEFP